jgi:hypothetical protein
MTISTNSQNVNEEIEVTALFFRQKTSQPRLEGFPRRMVWGGREYDFIEIGMEYLIKKGQHIVKLFDVSDGFANYRLRYDEGRWTLLSIKEQVAY